MPATPWPHRWNILALTVVAQAVIIGIQSFCFAFWVVPWLDEFRAPRSEIMLAITASILMGGVLSPFAGIALDRYSMRILYVVGISTFSLALFLISLAGSHWTIVLLYGGLLPIGVTLGGTIASQTLIARWFSRRRGTALGISSLGISLGAFIAPPIATLLLAAFGWRTAFQLLAAGSFLLIAPAAWIILSRLPDASEREAVRLADPDRQRLTTAALLRNRHLWIIAFAFFALLVPYLPVLYNLGAFARDLGISQQRAAIIASAGAAVLALGKASFGRLADMFELRRLYWVACGIMISGVVTASLATTFTALLIGMMLITFPGGCFLPLMGKMVVDRFGTADFGKAMGLASLFVQFSAFAPFLASVVRDSSGSYVTAFLSMVPVLPLAALALLWMVEIPASAKARGQALRFPHAKPD